MAMSLRRAFSSKMYTPVTRYILNDGYYDEINDWIEGAVTTKEVLVVIRAGEQHLRLDSGEARHATDGGIRYSNYKKINFTDSNFVDKGDKIGYQGKYFNVIQRTEADEFGFYDATIEESDHWTPPT